MLVGRRVLRSLKDQTADLHAEAEQYVRILDEDATLDDYRRYLAVMAGFHAPLEAAFDRQRELSRLGFDAPARRKSHLLARDLTALGVGAWTVCSNLPTVLGVARAIGIAYVIEGSTLGGRYILSRLPAGIDPIRGRATSFLDGYGEATGERWRAFGQVVERAVVSDGDEQAAIGGARDCFEKLIAWLALHEEPVVTRVRELA